MAVNMHVPHQNLALRRPRSSFIRLLRILLFYLVSGVLASVFIAWALHYGTDPGSFSPEVGDSAAWITTVPSDWPPPQTLWVHRTTFFEDSWCQTDPSLTPWY